MKISETSINGAFVVGAESFQDQRGQFTRLFCEQELAHVLGGRKIVQINHSLTYAKGAIRGLHYQWPPHAEMKLVRCLKGKVWDVVVDLRQDSPTFLTWHAEELSLQNAKMMVIPEGCAHGFQALEEESELLYLHTAYYKPDAEAGVRYDDPAFAISWPLQPQDLSARDSSYSLLDKHFEGIEL